MSARYSQKANLLAGGFLLGGVIAAVALSFIFADVSLTRTAGYVIRFSVADGATGLSPDAAVRVGGQQVGKVDAIRVERDAAGEFVVNVYVDLRADIEIYENAWAYLEVPLLGTASTLNIPYLGDPQGVESPDGSSPLLEPGEVLQGSVAPPLFLANAGYGPQQREQVQRMIAATERTLTELADAVAAISPEVGPVAQDVRATVASARRTAESVEADMDGWRATISGTLANAENASEKLPGVVDDVDILLADARELIRVGRESIEDNRPRIDNILSRTENVVASVEEQWVPRGTEMLASARDGADAYAQAGRRINTILAEQQPAIERTVANLRVTSDQLKFLAIEARAQPWRLLHRPDTKELENQLLYDTARSYAVAVSDLRAASEAMESVIDRAGATGQVDLDRLQAIRAKLQEAFEEYADAESALLDRMIQANE